MFLCCPDAQACQPVAAAFENAKPDVMKPKLLTWPWDRSAFKQNKPGDCGGILVWKLPAKCAVQITNCDATIDDP